MTWSKTPRFIAAIAMIAASTVVVSDATADTLDGAPDLVAVHVSRGAAFAVGKGGAIWSMEIKRGLWRAERTGAGTQPTANLLDVHVVSKKDVWVVGAAGTLLHFDGAEWTSPPGDRTADVRAVAFATRTRGIAVGDKGTVYNFVRGWQPFVAMSRKPSLYAIVRIGRGRHERFVAVGAKGDGMSFTGVGSSLAADDEITGVKTDLVAIAGCTGSKAEAVAVGTEAVLRDKSGAWRKLPAPPSPLSSVALTCRRGAVTAVHATSGTALLTYDTKSAKWTSRAIPDATTLTAITWLDKKRFLLLGTKGFATAVPASAAD